MDTGYLFQRGAAMFKIFSLTKNMLCFKFKLQNLEIVYLPGEILAYSDRVLNQRSTTNVKIQAVTRPKQNHKRGQTPLY